MMPTEDTFTLILIAIALLLALLARLSRPRLRRDVQQGIRAALRCYPALPQRRAYRRLTASRDGLAVAMLLLNAAAKTRKELYQHKVPLLRAIVAASQRHEWWLERHDHPLATDYTGTVAVFVETSIGQILPDIPRVQLSVHSSAEDAVQFPDAPAPAGRTWAGIALQARAEAIAQAFIAR
jgi:hypothetical protein